MNIADTNDNTYAPCVQYIRAYAQPVDKKSKSKDTDESHTPVAPSDESIAIQNFLKPYGGQVLVFDTETTNDNKKELLYGFFQLHGMTRDERIALYRDGTLDTRDRDTLVHAGCFYNPETLTEEERVLLKTYAENTLCGSIADKQGVTCEDRNMPMQFLEVQEFVSYLYSHMRDKDLLIVGHNLPFDISRLGRSWSESSKFSGGFSLKLCTCSYKNCDFHPHILIKHLGYGKHLYGMRVGRKYNRNKQGQYLYRDVHFLDTMQLSGALLGEATSLEKLGKSLKLPEHLHKLPRPITLPDIEYASQDVVTRFACWQALRDEYKQHDLTTDIWQMYSSASLGKAYLKAMDVKPFKDVHNDDISPEIIGYSMNAYYGARAEIGVRLQPVEIRHYDFRSQYPTVNALMKLQDVLLCKHITVQECAEKVRSILAQPDLLDRLQDKAFWLQLRCIVKVKPDGDRLPLRTNYGSKDPNIALPFVKGIPMWYTLADVIASTLLTGKSPLVLEAFEFIPSEEKYQTTPKRFMGSTDVIDLSKDDLFVKVIELRQYHKQLEEVADENQAYHKSMQFALKLIANSTSYGTLLEIHKEDDTKKQTYLACYYTVNGDEIYKQVHSVEKPGKYFAGCLGTLIPASGRLLLAIAQKLIENRGMTYAYCDTDAIAPVRPNGMSREEFIQKSQEVADWFQVLSPYSSGSLLKLEDDNQYEGKDEPLYFIGVSAKRYVLYNKLPDGTYRIRKFSGHGLGAIRRPYENDKSPFTDIPEPYGKKSKDVDEKLKDLGGSRWQYDVWYLFIRSLETGVDLNGKLPLYREPTTKTPFVHESLLPFKLPAMHQISITTWDTYEQYKRIDGIKPFSFFTFLYPVDNMACFKFIEEPEKYRLYKELADKSVTFYTSASTPEELQDRARYPIRRSDTHAIMPDWFEPVELCDYLSEPSHFSRTENKAINGKEAGCMLPRYMQVVEPLYIGKESYEIKDEQQEDSNGLLGTYTAQFYGSGSNTVTNWNDTLEPYHIADLVLLSRIPRTTIYNVGSGKIQPEKDTRDGLMTAIYRLQSDSSLSLWRQLPYDRLATMCNVSLEIAKRMKYGKHNFTDNEREIILKFCKGNVR